ncbi:putative transferase, protein kinase RLK-Pelle-RLCK-VIIa-2 family [Helianthus debilis subsp. tardiflorus]
MFADLESATRNFSQDLHLGRGYFGHLFLGWIEKKSFAPSRCGDGIAVVVKRSRSITSQRNDKRLAAVSLLGQLVHPNIVGLLGYCLHGDENLLVYEYYENRTLDIFLFANAPDISKPLSWEERLRIMIGVARGLTYLHSSKEQILCHGVQSSDILLDQELNAKLLDFGLEKSCLEFERTGHMMSDIYGFGVLLIEILTALPAIGENTPDEHYSLVEWASQILANKRNLKDIIDPRLEQNYPLESAFECGALAIKCVANKRNDRPSSKDVLQVLERIYAVSLIWKDADKT